MKPIILEIEGLNSFEEKQTLNFDELGDGLFGIFGNTGSGKSTLLDAITLGLYGKVERSKQNIDFINTKKSKAKVVLVFEIFYAGKQRRYQIERTFSRKKNGKDADQVAFLYEVEGDGLKMIEEGASKVSDKVFSIIGLGADEFSKCIALPQGEFASFLKAKASERTEIMSKIFDLSKYGERLAATVKDRVAELDKEMSSVEVAKNMLSYATDNLIAEIEGNLKEFKENYEADNKSLQEKEELLNEKKKQKDAYTKLIKLKEDFEEKSSKLEEIEQTKKTIEKSRSAGALRSDYDRLKKIEIDTKEIEEKLSQMEESRLQKESAFAAAEVDYDAFKSVYGAKIVELNTKLATLQSVTKLDEEIQELTSKQIEIAGEIDSEQKELAAEYENNNYTQSEINKIQEQIEELDEFIDTNKPDVEMTNALEQTKGIESELILIADFEKQVSSLVDLMEEELGIAQQIYTDSIKAENINNEKLNQIKSSIEVAFENEDSTDFNKLRSVDRQLYSMDEVKSLLSFLEEKIQLLEDDIARREDVVHDLELQTQMAETDFEKAESEIASKQRDTEKLRTEREEMLGENVVSMISDNLKIGDFCPVCSQRVIQKVYGEKNDLSTIEGEIENAKRLTQNSISASYNALAKLITIKTRIELEKGLIETDKNEIELIKEKKSKLYQKFVDINDDSEEKFANLYNLLDSTSCSLEELLDLQFKLRDKSEEYAVAKAQAGAKVSVLKDYHDKLLDIIYVLQTKKAERELAIYNVSVGYENLKEYKKQIAEGKSIELIVDEKKEQRAKLGDKRYELTKQKNESDLKIASISSKIELLNQEKDANEKQISSVNKKLQTSGVPEGVLVEEKIEETNSELNRLKIDSDDKLSKYETCKEVLSRAESDYQVNKTLLNEKLEETKTLKVEIEKNMQENGFSTREELENCFMSPDEIKEKQAQIEEFVANFEQIRAQIAIFENENPQNHGEAEIFSLSKDVDELALKLKNFAENIGKASADLERIKADNQKLKEATSQFEDIKKKYDIAKELASVLRGKALAEYVCEEYLQEITASANKKLAYLMNGQYNLKFENKEFFVEDNFNDGEVRPASTLSGGETFVISLSLALSISEAISMLSSRTMDFFFLDEGFGTLDSELCMAVVATLEKLEAKNLKIGLITHVTELEDAVKNKVMVTKTAKGSVLKIEHSL